MREGRRLVALATVVATGVNADGHREILGVDVISAEDGAGWTAFLRGLVARGLNRVALVVSDAHEGLKNSIGVVLTGAASQRCRTHAMRNLPHDPDDRSEQDDGACAPQKPVVLAPEIWEERPRFGPLPASNFQELLAGSGRRLSGHIHRGGSTGEPER